MPTLEPDHDILVFDKVEATYGEAPILRGVSFGVHKGKITTLIGPNGAGKSTVLRAALGTVRVTHGQIVYSHQPITGVSTTDRQRKGMAYCPQGRSNFPRMTVRENLEMGAFLRSDREVQEDIETLLDEFPLLREKQKEFAANLSGGQQQILEMAMALILHPRILLIDEPSLGLSPIMVEQVFAYVKEINGQGVTVLMVEQNARRALAISDYGIVLDLGRVRLKDTGEALLNNEEVSRSYLGS